jgi:hypothetical protein
MKTIAAIRTLAAIIMAVICCAGSAWAGSIGSAVEVRIVTDDGRVLPTYPVKSKRGLSKVYAEAVKGDHYRIEVRNNLDRRVGVVIAVDGRNIISGGKSWLKNHERMYILEPYGSGEFSGWRTNRNSINRFYFTDVPDSYASAFGDESAMGVIAVAAYPEKRRYEPPPMPQSEATPGFMRKGNNSADRAQAAPAPSSESRAKKLSKAEKSMESAGTGYGREEYSPSYNVTFEPEQRAAERVYVKYEWHSTLCKRGVVVCDTPHHRPPNRLWDHGGYAPPPPGR